MPGDQRRDPAKCLSVDWICNLLASRLLDDSRWASGINACNLKSAASSPVWVGVLFFLKKVPLWHISVDNTPSTCGRTQIHFELWNKILKKKRQKNKSHLKESANRYFFAHSRKKDFVRTKHCSVHKTDPNFLKEMWLFEICSKNDFASRLFQLCIFSYDNCITQW